MGIRNRISKKDNLSTIEQKLTANLKAKSNFKNKGLTHEEFGFKLTLLEIVQEIIKNTTET
jgi:hypothetical protein